MKKLIFQELMIVSDSEKSAERFQFGPNTNLILGASNKVGKTSLSTSLMWSLGCATKFPPKWSSLNIKTLVKFNIDGDDYIIKRKKDSISIYYPSGAVKIFEKITGKYSEELGDILNCPIFIKNKNGSTISGTPSTQFLASYIHSDTGWGEIFKSFSDLDMYPLLERKYILEYFLGIRDVDFFKIRKSRLKLEGDISEAKEKISRLSVINNDIKSLLSYDNSTDSRYEQIEPLIEERSFYLSNIIDAKSQKYEIKKRIRLIEQAEHELFNDYKFATNNIEGQLITCPTCGVVHKNDIVNRFSIIDERESLKEHRINALDELLEMSDYITKEQKKIDEINSKISINEKLYNLSSEDFDLVKVAKSKDVIESVFSELLIVEEKSKSRSEVELLKLPKFNAKSATFKNNAKLIKTEFAISLIKSLHDFNVMDANEDDIAQDPYSKIHVSGSDISRTTLAYYKTLNEFKMKYCDAVILPFMCDSPMQQEQDDNNIDSVVAIIKKWKGQQFFLFGKDYPSYEDLKNAPTSNVIFLNRDRRILSKERYEQLNDEFENEI